MSKLSSEKIGASRAIDTYIEALGGKVGLVPDGKVDGRIVDEHRDDLGRLIVRRWI